MFFVCIMVYVCIRVHTCTYLCMCAYACVAVFIHMFMIVGTSICMYTCICMLFRKGGCDLAISPSADFEVNESLLHLLFNQIMILSLTLVTYFCASVYKNR